MKFIPTKAGRLIAAVCFVAVALLSGAYAQEVRGTITGRVLDANKAIVPGAMVRITNEAQGTSVAVQTTDAGLFRAPNLIPGTYQVVVEVSGFKKYVRNGLELRIGETIEANVELEVGTVDQSVTITGDAPTLETATASQGQIVDSRRVAELPLVHGDPYTMMGLAPGVSFARDQRLDRPFEPTHIVGFNIDGVRANRSDL